MSCNLLIHTLCKLYAEATHVALVLLCDLSSVLSVPHEQCHVQHPTSSSLSLHIAAFHKAFGPCLQLPATAIHDIATASVILRNTTSDPQTFEFSIPQGSDMTLSPHVDTIKGGGSLRVMLRYCPQSSTAPAVPAESELQPAEPSGATPEGTAGSNGAVAASAADTDEVRMRRCVSVAHMSPCCVYVMCVWNVRSSCSNCRSPTTAQSP